MLLGAAVAGWYWWQIDHTKALAVAVAVLIVTCPCALSLATPAAMLTSAGALARRGILVRRLQALETLSRINAVVFDKTGTLTHDRLELVGVKAREEMKADEVLGLAATLARGSLHPVSRALVAAAGDRSLDSASDDGIDPGSGAGRPRHASHAGGWSLAQAGFCCVLWP